MDKHQRIMLVAGEASGDQHAAKLIREVRQLNSDVEFFGIGGKAMHKAGCEILIDSAELAVVGLIEVLAHWSTIKGALVKMQEILRNQPPDLLILTDYPDFNLRLAKTARECGVKVLYYISPQVWAWRQKRVNLIREVVDHMAVVFPFEEEFYRKHHVPVSFVGHPLVDEVHASASREQLIEEFQLDAEKPVVGLFPGSRRSEIKRLLPIILQTAIELKKHKADVQFILPVASTLSDELIQPYIEQHDISVTMINERSYDVMQVCDAIVTVSGTVTLEIALMGKPMVIINRIAWLSYQVVSRMLKIPYIGLCNIVAGKKIAPELIQHDATVEKITATLLRLLDDNEYRQQMINDMSEVHNKLQSGDGSKVELADVVLQMLK